MVYNGIIRLAFVKTSARQGETPHLFSAGRNKLFHNLNVPATLKLRSNFLRGEAMKNMPKLSLADDIEKKSGYNWKILSLDILGIFWSLICGFLILKVFQGEIFLGFHSAWWLILFSLLFLGNFIIESVFSEKTRFVFVFLQALAFGAGFYLAGDLLSYWRIGLAIIPLIFIYLGKRSIISAEQDMLKLRWWRMTRRGATLILMGLITFSIVGFGIFFLEKPGDDLIISQEGLSRFLSPSNSIFRIFYEDFSWNMRIDDFSKGLVEKTAGDLLDDPSGSSFDNLPLSINGILEAKKKEAIQQSAGMIISQISSFLRIDIENSDTLENIFHKWISQKFNSFSDFTRRSLIVGFLIVILLIARAIVPIVSIIIRAITWLIYEFFLATGFAVIAYETKSKENAVFS